MKKNTGRKGYLKRIMMTLSAFILILTIPITVLADGNFAGNITITKAVEGYEYKVYEVLECVGAGGEDSLFMSKGNWTEFLRTNENAVAMLTPAENDGHYRVDEGSDLYTVNMESYKAVRQAFAEDVLEYAKENGIDAYESITAEESKIIFEYVPLGIYVVDTADKARITVMWDMDWESEIKESYEKAAEENPPVEASVEEAVKESVPVQEEAVTKETDSEVDAVQEAEINAEEASATADNTKPEPSIDGSNKAVIVVIVVLILAVAGFVFIKSRRK